MTKLGWLVAVLLAVSGFGAQMVANGILIKQAVAAGAGEIPPPECDMTKLGLKWHFKRELLICVPIVLPDGESSSAVWAMLSR